ncbi:MAG TPA: hypothetical protein VFD82_04880 [Planctomycetota bacterium]|nr:hypothetical protein [Planctomycetota bacterium]
MFRIAHVVLLTASLCSVAFAQKNPIKQAPAEPIEEPIAAGTVLEDGTVVKAPSDEPLGTASLKMSFNGMFVQAYIHSSEPGFVGVVGLSLNKNLTYSFGLPPLLTDAVVMAWGATDGEDLDLRAALSTLPAESINLFGQALVIDEKGLWSSNVVGLTIGGKQDGNKPAPAIN